MVFAGAIGEEFGLVLGRRGEGRAQEKSGSGTLLEEARNQRDGGGEYGSHREAGAEYDDTGGGGAMSLEECVGCDGHQPGGYGGHGEGRNAEQDGGDGDTAEQKPESKP